VKRGDGVGSDRYRGVVYMWPRKTGFFAVQDFPRSPSKNRAEVAAMKSIMPQTELKLSSQIAISVTKSMQRAARIRIYIVLKAQFIACGRIANCCQRSFAL
jgi:hypothetical protein